MVLSDLIACNTVVAISSIDLLVVTTHGMDSFFIMAMMKKESIPWVVTTSKSIEEIATTVLQAIKSDKTILG